MFSRHRRPQDSAATQPEVSGQSDPPTEYFRLGRLRLYQQDEILASRVPDGAAVIGAYCKTLVWVGTEYFHRLGRDFGSLGLLIAVGIKPNRRIKLWCDVVEGMIPDDVWEPFVSLLEGAGKNVRPEVTAPVALALECLVGAGPEGPFPVFPVAWREAALQGDGTTMSVPDELFEVVFPD